MKLYWGPGAKVRVIQDGLRPADFIGTIKFIDHRDSIPLHLLSVPVGHAQWYRWSEVVPVEPTRRGTDET
jgi:hypothetical protein